ncbi:2'-5' RNA ligase family protein [Nocardia arthritidis]|nr:2'-5' RNA ligase family protein [Nocardia arthritidis]
MFMVDQLKRRWPVDWTKLHIYFVPDSAEIKPLVDAYRGIIDDVEFVSPQPDEWLHATLMVVDGIAARDVPGPQRAELVERLQRAAAEVPSFEVTCGPAVAGRSSIALDLVPDRDFTELRNRVTTAAGEIFGPEAVRYQNGRPHITLAYARGKGDSGPLQTRLRNATDRRAPLTVNNIRLVDVLVDFENLQFRWEELAVLSLHN